jgi:hypothetical protein
VRRPISCRRSVVTLRSWSSLGSSRFTSSSLPQSTRPGRHETDLRALNQTQSELTAAARWSITGDPSPGWRAVSGPALCAPWRESRRPRPVRCMTTSATAAAVVVAAASGSGSDTPIPGDAPAPVLVSV